jgi:hypothetical protein
MTEINLFDSKGRFVLPDAVPADWDQSKIDRFEALKAAALAAESCERDFEQTKNVTLPAAIAAFKAAQQRLNELRPPLSRIQLTKDFIRSQRGRP